MVALRSLYVIDSTTAHIIFDITISIYWLHHQQLLRPTSRNKIFFKERLNSNSSDWIFVQFIAFTFPSSPRWTIISNKSNITSSTNSALDFLVQKFTHTNIGLYNEDRIGAERISKGIALHEYSTNLRHQPSAKGSGYRGSLTRSSHSTGSNDNRTGLQWIVAKWM